MYYLRTKSAADAIKFTVDGKYTMKTKPAIAAPPEALVCNLENKDGCLVCSS